MSRSLVSTCHGLVSVRKHGVRMRTAKKKSEISFFLVLESLLFKDISPLPLGRWLLFLVVKTSNPLISGS